MNSYSFVAGADQAGQRLDRFVYEHIFSAGLTRSTVQNLIRQGLVEVDGLPVSKPSHKIAAGKNVIIHYEKQDKTLTPLKGHLSIVYEDESLVLLNKRSGISVHPAPSENDPTIVHYLLEKYPCLQNLSDNERPGIVHRLDKDTSGLMLVALNDAARQYLSNAFHDRIVGKWYLVMVQGCLENPTGEINKPMCRDPKSKTKMAVSSRQGRQARTRYYTLYRGKGLQWSLLLIRIFTGRTHQIRVHLAHVGHPVIGDLLYSASKPGFSQTRIFKDKLVKRQLLHSGRIDFPHPSDESRKVFCQLPSKDFTRVCLNLESRVQKVVLTGSLGSGKSSVSALFNKHGVPVFSADECVAELYEPGQDGWHLIQQRFGSRFIDYPHGPVNKKKLSKAILNDRFMLDELNHLIHPLVKHKLDEFWQNHKDCRMALAEVPLFFEAGMDDPSIITVGVFCPDETRLQRVCSVRKITAENFLFLNKAQWPQLRKIKSCQLVIDNSLDKQSLICKAKALTRVLQYLRRHNIIKIKHSFEYVMKANLRNPPEYLNDPT
ncbi:dephospho-CoA kinase [Desulfonatronovibrio magnus]|uniref:dephospho-CoA kinase n=1 Tax=Desulfonatronovibrio magnus TaxID=698827 RepID=UPI00069863FC|nr:dephospho-CoA kinase [Desulfonatronovibrio magnus]RQD56944.1 MAG: dephospho-CoA kinase [Desulfonatronovibrio sp. MSAO_Bac4]